MSADATDGRPERTGTTVWGVTARLYRCLGLLGCVDHRDDDALGTSVEHLADDAGFVPGDTDDRDRTAMFDCPDQFDGDLVLDGAVLGVDADIIEARPCHDLGGERRRDREPPADRVVPIGPHLSKCSHARMSSASTVTMKSPGATR